MNQETTQTPSRQDTALLRKIVLKLTATANITCAVLVVLVALVWYDLLNRLLAFGNGLDYAGNRLMGAEATALVQRYNPYFWGVLVALCTILLAWWVYLIVRAIHRRSRLKLVDAHSFSQLAEQLSAPALDVLLWAWQPHDEPLRVGDLQLARAELSGGRAARLQQAAQQLAVLQNARQREH
ncbi:hypothetical protein [Castellaniella caeni]|uniref:hypothetical protein n=1 Tax=Castellaniella caeni TaxID=266123 RepID=UPI00083234E2|nr:hypothetical protein [Castellaniella caeni]